MIEQPLPFNRIKQSILASDANKATDCNWGVPGSPVDGSEYFRYEATFQPFGYHSITSFLEQRKQAGKSAFMLDLAGGDGHAIRSLDAKQLIDGGLTVSLTDQRHEWDHDRQKSYDQDHELGFVAGNLLRGSTWRDLNDWAKANTPNGKFDLIVCRPLSGGDITIPIHAFQPLFNRVWTLLNPRGGLFLSQIPRDLELFGREAFDTYMERLNQIPGIQADYNHQLMILQIKRTFGEDGLSLPESYLQFLIPPKASEVVAAPHGLEISDLDPDNNKFLDLRVTEPRDIPLDLAQLAAYELQIKRMRQAYLANPDSKIQLPTLPEGLDLYDIEEQSDEYLEGKVPPDRRVVLEAGISHLSDELIFVFYMDVHPRYRSQRLGTGFYTRLRELAWSMGYKYIAGNNSENNIDFFVEKLGRRTLNNLPPSLYGKLEPVLSNLGEDEDFLTIDVL